MTPFMEDGKGADLARRRVLRDGLAGAALLAGSGILTSLSGCSAPPPASSGMQLLRADDQLFFAALYPVVLGGSLAQEPVQRSRQLEQAVRSLDQYLSRISPVMQQQLMQLLDLVHMSATRGPLTGVWGTWSSATDEQIQGYLQRWKNSSMQLLRMGYSLLMQLMVMAWYLVPSSWPAAGYPGPPFQEQLITTPNHY
ncbi:hypothetical protein [Aestuariirhabdus sp. LZHN29]|uniref:hypothetical protein n=1 Tax=Aestuariirhabdus sp. LZHN29 TaxID=3417462 RepID=UPI003CFAED29